MFIFGSFYSELLKTRDIGGGKRKIAAGIMSCNVWMEMDLKWARKPHSGHVQTKTLGEYFIGTFILSTRFSDKDGFIHSQCIQKPLSFSTSIMKLYIEVCDSKFHYFTFWNSWSQGETTTRGQTFFFFCATKIQRGQILVNFQCRF